MKVKYAYLPTEQVKSVMLAALNERLKSFDDIAAAWGDAKHQTMDAMTWLHNLPTCNGVTSPKKKRGGES